MKNKMDTGVFFMKKDSEIYRGFWYTSVTPSIQKDDRTFYIPLHKDFFSKNGVKKDVIMKLGYKLETYTLRDKDLSDEFKFLIFYHLNTLNEHVRIEDLFYSVLGDFIENYYSELLSDFSLLINKNLISNETNSKIDKNIHSILELCAKHKLLKKKTIQKILQRNEERNVTENDIIKKIFLRI